MYLDLYVFYCLMMIFAGWGVLLDQHLGRISVKYKSSVKRKLIIEHNMALSRRNLWMVQYPKSRSLALTPPLLRVFAQFRRFFCQLRVQSRTLMSNPIHYENAWQRTAQYWGISPPSINLHGAASEYSMRWALWSRSNFQHSTQFGQILDLSCCFINVIQMHLNSVSVIVNSYNMLSYITRTRVSKGLNEWLFTQLLIPHTKKYIWPFVMYYINY